MQNWKKLDKVEKNNLWDYISSKLSFNPRNSENTIIPKELLYKCYDISSHYNENFKLENYDELHDYTLNLFRILSSKKVYALDWMHDCFVFDPNLPFELDEFEEWLISVFPNGDFVFFITENLENIIFADGINSKIYFLGREIVEFLKLNRPKILDKEILV